MTLNVVVLIRSVRLEYDPPAARHAIRRMVARAMVRHRHGADRTALTRPLPQRRC